MMKRRNRFLKRLNPGGQNIEAPKIEKQSILPSRDRHWEFLGSHFCTGIGPEWSDSMIMHFHDDVCIAPSLYNQRIINDQQSKSITSALYQSGARRKCSPLSHDRAMNFRSFGDLSGQRSDHGIDVISENAHYTSFLYNGC